MSATLPLYLTCAPQTEALSTLKNIHAAVVSKDWVLLRYAEDLLRELKIRSCLPDKFFLGVQRSHAREQPPNPTPTAAAPKAKGPSTKAIGHALKAAAEKICGLLGDIAPLVPNYYSQNPALSPDESLKYWMSPY